MTADPRSGAASAKDMPSFKERLAASDAWRGLMSWQLWGTLGWLEVRQRYRRSLIGPFWITLSLGFIVGGLGIVYSTLFNQNIDDYIPYLATGLICWTLISGMINDGCTVFIMAEPSIRKLPVPLSVYAYRMVWRHLIILVHNFVIYIAVAAWFRVNPGTNGLIAIVGLTAAALNGIAFGLTLGILSARFRDIPLIIANAVQLVFFVTPILWRPDSLSARAWIVHLNPFYYLIEVVRQPLLGIAPDAFTWLVVAIMTVVNGAIALSLFTKFRWRIAYWL